MLCSFTFPQGIHSLLYHLLTLYVFVIIYYL